MTKPTLSVVSNEVEVELTEANDPRLAGWRQATRFWCRADHEIIVDNVVEDRSGGLVDEAHFLRVSVSTRVGNQDPTPFDQPLYFRRQSDRGRSSMAWFDRAEFERRCAQSLDDLVQRVADIQRASGLGEIDVLLLARLSLARMLGDLPGGTSGAADAREIADQAYQLGYLVALDDAKARGVDSLATTGDKAAKQRTEASLKGATAVRRDDWRDRAREIWAMEPHLTVHAVASKIVDIPKDASGIRSISRAIEGLKPA